MSNGQVDSPLAQAISSFFLLLLLLLSHHVIILPAIYPPPSSSSVARALQTQGAIFTPNTSPLPPLFPLLSSLPPPPPLHAPHVAIHTSSLSPPSSTVRTKKAFYSRKENSGRSVGGREGGKITLELLFCGFFPLLPLLAEVALGDCRRPAAVSAGLRRHLLLLLLPLLQGGLGGSIAHAQTQVPLVVFFFSLDSTALSNSSSSSLRRSSTGLPSPPLSLTHTSTHQLSSLSPSLFGLKARKTAGGGGAEEGGRGMEQHRERERESRRRRRPQGCCCYCCCCCHLLLFLVFLSKKAFVLPPPRCAQSSRTRRGRLHATTYYILAVPCPLPLPPPSFSVGLSLPPQRQPKAAQDHHTVARARLPATAAAAAAAAATSTAHLERRKPLLKGKQLFPLLFLPFSCGGRRKRQQGRHRSPSPLLPSDREKEESGGGGGGGGGVIP